MAGHPQHGKSRAAPVRPPPPRVTINTTPPSVQKHFEQLKPLSAEKVRWFYEEERKWIPFCGADSLNIECVYRSLPAALQSPLLIPKDIDASTVTFPTVLGAAYEVDIFERKCRSIYWKENAIPIRRGTWFKGTLADNWEPIDEKQALIIEEGHFQVIRSLGFGSDSASPASQNVIHHIKLGANRVDWHDIGEAYMVSESASSRLAQKIGFGGATALHRGYEKVAESTDSPGPISHMVFMVHGIGQLYHEGGIVQSRKKFVEAIEKGNKKLFKEIDEGKKRVQFFPIEWRTKLKLDEGIIDMITPENLGSLRKVINHTTLDVFYYTSPYYREEIIQATREELNSVYKRFCDRNPSFVQNGGKVSIIAHSLGSVIIHDVLTIWNSYLVEKDKKIGDKQVAVGERSYSWFWGWGIEKELGSQSSLSGKSEDVLKRKLHQARLKVAKIEAQINGQNFEQKDDAAYSLLFKVEYVFNIGSPLGVFLVMRGIRPRDDMEQHILPVSVCKRIFNVYDPADPVAYRLEPVIYNYYADVPPVRLASVGASLEPKQSKLNAPQAAGWLKTLFGGKIAQGQNMAVEYQGSSSIELPKAQFEKVEKLLEGKKRLSHRIDYVLEQSMIEYFSALTSHQAYWHNLDFAKFVLQALNTTDDNEDEILAELTRRNSRLE